MAQRVGLRPGGGSRMSKTEWGKAAQTGLDLGETFGWLTVPLRVIGSGKDKRVVFLSKYKDFNGHGYTPKRFRELWEGKTDAPGLAILSDEVVEIEADSAKGVEALKGRKFPRTPTYNSKRGVKYLFAAPDDTDPILTGPKANERLGPDTEVLHHKPLIIPPTPGYTYRKGRSLHDVRLADIPADVVAVLRPKRAHSRPAKRSPGGVIYVEGERDNSLASLAGAMRRKGAEKRAILAALLKVNEDQCRPPLKKDQVEKIAQSIVQYDPAEEKERWTDLGNAHRMVETYRDRILYCPDHRAWYIWNGRFWGRDRELQIMVFAKETVQGMRLEAESIEGDDDREKFIRWCDASQNTAKLKAMIESAQSEVVIKPEELDARPYLLCVENGTLNLKTGKLRPHDPADLITLMAPVEYDPDAMDPRWEEVLDRFVRPESDLEEFLQRAAFASLTGTSEKAFINLFDDQVGDTGKTTFVGSLLAALGPYGVEVKADAFLMDRGGGVGRIRSELAACYGKRMVVSSEAPAGRHLDVELMKKLTSGFGRFMYERKFENPWEGEITFTIWLDGNSVARARVEDNPLFARWRLAPFRHKIGRSERDAKWLEKASRSPAYRAAVLAWAMRGRKAWRKDGIGSTRVVDKATAQVRKAMDPLAEFWAEHVRFGKGHFVTSERLRSRLEAWHSNRGGRGHAINDHDLGSLLKARGATRGTKRIQGVTRRGWKGVGLRANG
jgi:P4 family phage/plasmid primase-like protien